MNERTHLVVVPPASTPCAVCGLAVGPFDGTSTCERCALYLQLERTTSTWSSEGREAVLATVYHVVRMLPPEEVEPFFRLLSRVCVVDH